jgi:hypothetical protein
MSDGRGLEETENPRSVNRRRFTLPRVISSAD